MFYKKPVSDVKIRWTKVTNFELKVNPWNYVKLKFGD